MKNWILATLALLCAACANATLINVAHQDWQKLEFYAGPPDGDSTEYYFYITDSGTASQSLSDLTATPAGANVAFTVFWTAPNYHVSDSFTLTPGGPVDFDGDLAEFRDGLWFFLYQNPNPLETTIPDHLNSLGMLAAVVLGLFRLR